MSRQFAKPAYQSQLAGAFRHTPDLALNADPSTGVQFRVFGSSVVYGGTSVVAAGSGGVPGARKLQDVRAPTLVRIHIPS